ncbi:MAG TPA: DMT family transporter [Hanamia sp.]|nr:DMT family transporter [Hanamia sp.]
MNSTLKAHLGLLGTNLFFATNYSAIKYFTSHHYAGPLGINIIRVGVSLVLFWLLFLFKRPEKRIEKKDIPALILCTLTAIALNQLLFIEGLSFTFPIHAALLTLITPILITIIAARILNERVTVAKLVGLSLGAFGAVLLVTQREITAPGENVVLGDILVILSAVAYTFYFILVKPLMNKYSAVQMIRWIFTIGFIMTFPFCFTQFSHITWNVFTFKDWFFLFLVVVPGTFLAYVFNVYGIQKLSASKAGAYIYSQPVFAVVIAVIFLKESLSIYKIIAGVLIFAGVFLSNKKHN